MKACCFNRWSFNLPDGPVARQTVFTDSISGTPITLRGNRAVLQNQSIVLPGDTTGNLHKLDVPPRTVLERLLGERRRDFVSYEDWQLIDMLERERGEAQGAPRVKFARVEEMLHALQERKRQAAEEAEAEAAQAARAQAARAGDPS